MMHLLVSAASKLRLASALIAVIGAAVVLSSSDTPVFTERDKAYYADPNLVNFVRPGLVLKILSASIEDDGTIKARFKITDPRGLPLDREGITTPGPVSVRLMAAYIPKGQTQYVAYTTRVQTSPITRVSATQAHYDVGGTFTKVGDGRICLYLRHQSASQFRSHGYARHRRLGGPGPERVRPPIHQQLRRRRLHLGARRLQGHSGAGRHQNANLQQVPRPALGA
jgi:hypothetical protein